MLYYGIAPVSIHSIVANEKRSKQRKRNEEDIKKFEKYNNKTWSIIIEFESHHRKNPPNNYFLTIQIANTLDLYELFQANIFHIAYWFLNTMTSVVNTFVSFVLFLNDFKFGGIKEADDRHYKKGVSAEHTKSSREEM